MTKKTQATLILSLTLFTIANAQKDDKPILRIDNHVATYGEFRHMYEQNKASALTPISEAEYFDLFTAYKLKVVEAHALGIDTTSSYKAEKEQYINELAQGYLVDSTAYDRYKARLVSRLNQEVHARHILVSVLPSSSPADTVIAYQKIEKARQRVLSGEDFARVAAEVSEDPSAKTNSGDLGYFSALSMVSQFEDMAYNTPIGSVSQIFRTRFGYHILKVDDRRPWEGEVHVAHIMKFPSKDNTAKQTIDSIYTLLKSGADFAATATKLSDDKGTAVKGGELPWFERGRILPEFAEAAFNLSDKKPLSQPILSRAGWHIIKFLGRRTERPTDEIDKLFERMKQRVPELHNLPTSSYMASLAKTYNYKWLRADSIVNIMLSHDAMDSKTKRIETLVDAATIDSKNLSGKDIAQKCIRNWNAQALPSENLTAIRDALLSDYEKTQLTIKSSDYRYTQKEYSEGLLVFEVSSNNIWNTQPDSATIAQIYASNPNRYSTGSRFEGKIYFCNSLKDVAKVKKYLAKKNIAKANSLAYKVVEGPINQGGSYDDVLWPASQRSAYVVLDGSFVSGTTLPIEKCKAQILTDYQQKKEAEYVSRLREKYKPKALVKF